MIYIVTFIYLKFCKFKYITWHIFQISKNMPKQPVLFLFNRNKRTNMSCPKGYVLSIIFYFNYYILFL